MQTDYCYFGLRLLADLDITLRSESVLLMEIEFVGVHYPPNLVVPAVRQLGRFRTSGMT